MLPFNTPVDLWCCACADAQAEGTVTYSSVTLVDLAGSEGMVRMAAEGQQLMEGKHINRSLLTLGKVMRLLAAGKGGWHTVAAATQYDLKIR